MVIMNVCKQYGINLPEFLSKHLLAEIRTAIDQHPCISGLDKTDARSLLSCISELWHTLHLQPIVGTPTEVPVPRNVSLMSDYIHFWIDLDTKLVRYISLYCVTQPKYFTTVGPTMIDKHQCLP